MPQQTAHAPARPSGDYQGPKRYYDQFSDSETAAACISPAISTVALASRSPAFTARRVTEIITYTANSVASAPTAKAPATAAAIVTAITDHVPNVLADPGNKFTTICRLVGEVGDIPDFLPGFVEVIAGINLIIKNAERLPRDYVAVTIALVVAAVANAIANAPAGTRLAISAAYKTSAKHAVGVVSSPFPKQAGAKRPLRNIYIVVESADVLARFGGVATPCWR